MQTTNLINSNAKSISHHKKHSLNEFYVQLLLITTDTKEHPRTKTRKSLKITNRLNLILNSLLSQSSPSILWSSKHCMGFLFAQIPVDSRQSDSVSRARLSIRPKKRNKQTIILCEFSISVWKLRFGAIKEITCYLNKRASDFLLPSEHFSFSRETIIIIRRPFKTTFTLGKFKTYHFTDFC